MIYPLYWKYFLTLTASEINVFYKFHEAFIIKVSFTATDFCKHFRVVFTAY